MNKKEELIWRVIDNVINCCAVTRIDGAKSITREDVVGKSRVIIRIKLLLFSRLILLSKVLVM